MTIKQKLFLGFGLAAALLITSVGIARWAQAKSHANHDSVLRNKDLLKDIEHLDAYVNRVTALQRGYLISGDASILEPIAAMRQEADVIIPRVGAAIKGEPEQEQRLALWRDRMMKRRAFVNKLVAARKEQGAEAAQAIFNSGEDNRLYGDMHDAIAAMIAAASEQVTSEQAANAEFQQRISWIEGLAVVFARAMMVVIALALVGSIQKNVEIAVQMVGAMAKRDLSGSDGVPASEDELAGAIHAINRMKQSMTAALGEVSSSSSQLTAAGAQIDSAARQLQATTQHEKQNVEQFASALAEMNATVKEVAQHAEQASNAATDAVSSAAQGQQLVHQTHDAMNRIHASVSAASNDIVTLGEETQSIGEVVRIIQEIAGQTNLLALNAAIEAARAGEQGKGFAVVAQEVRALAERTAKFTNEIGVKIESVQQGAGRAVNSMRQGEAVVNEGVGQFKQVSDALDAIAQRIATAQQGITMIATATTQQSAATEGLTENIHRISNEVNDSAAQVDRTAETCSDLAQLAAGLQSIVDGFQLPA
jgi:methyl-accepting chemotaxis protein